MLLAGLVISLALPTYTSVVYLPQDWELRVLYSCAIVVLTVWALTVPLCFKFTLSKRAALLGVGMYAAYQTIYLTALIGGGD